jgi:hypothetical protein
MSRQYNLLHYITVYLLLERGRGCWITWCCFLPSAYVIVNRYGRGARLTWPYWYPMYTRSPASLGSVSSWRLDIVSAVGYALMQMRHK